MITAAVNKINTKLKDIPGNFAKEIIAYLDFLSFKANTGDWATSLSAKEFQLVQRGTEDINKGRVFSHSDAMTKINAQIKRKQK